MDEAWSAVSEIRRIAAGAPLAIGEEFRRTANSWMACFTSCVFQIEIYLNTKKAKEELGSERHAIADGKLESLKWRVFRLKKEYPEKDTTPMDMIKQELFSMLNGILKEKEGK